jgi:hypothetical protein
MHDSLLFYALLQKKAVEKAVGPTWIRGNEDKARAKLPIALDTPCRYLELARNERLSTLHIRVVDANYQEFGGLGRWDELTVRRIESLGLELPT